MSFKSFIKDLHEKNAARNEEAGPIKLGADFVIDTPFGRKRIDLSKVKDKLSQIGKNNEEE